jgi:hypothetical protein
VIGDLAAISRDDVASAWRLLRALPALLRRPLSVEEARAVLRERLERREARFVAFVRSAVYDNPASPYRELLRLAGCEAGDLERLVHTDGIEAALHRLYRAGVYLTIDEFKGRVPAVRGGTVVHVDPERLHNPLVSADLRVRSGGTRGRETLVPIGLDSIREVAVNQCLSLEARGGLDWPWAVYGVPGGSSTRVVMRHAAFGRPPVRWFSQIDPRAPELHPRYRWSERVLRWGSRLGGVTIPRPEHVRPEDPRPIVEWMAAVRRAGGTPHLRTFASAAVTICRSGATLGLDLAGAEFTVTGEPCTPARRAAIESVGARAGSNYATMEAGGPIAYGCVRPTIADESHLYIDTHAIVQPGPGGGPGALPPLALLVSTLFAGSPLVLINVSAGDQAELAPRGCGCPLEALGWTTRMHTIRSFEKLTAGGMTFLDRDVIRILEEVLPSRFGGRPGDYQLVEGEDERGGARLELIVAPALGPLDEEAIRQAFLQAVGAGDGARQVVSLDWREAGLVRVRRQAPKTNSAGKIFHVVPNGRKPTSPSA